MPLEVRLPELGGSVTHAKLTRWLKREGDRLALGEPIAEVETDKTNVEIEAPGDGILAKIHVSEGTDGVAVNTLLASIVIDGSSSEPPAATQGETSPAPRAASLRAPTEAPAQESLRSAIESPVASAQPSTSAAADEADAGIAASPLARRMAFAAGISLSSIVGTRSGGRITKEDVEAVIRQHRGIEAPQPAAVAAQPSSDVSSGPYEVQSLSSMRRVTAERLVQAKQTIPHFYLRIDCAMDRVSRMRQELNARGEEPLSVTAFVVRAAALALRKVPTANSAWVNGTLRVYKNADIAVAVNTPSGLIAPILRQAETKSLAMIAREVRSLAERGRAGRLKPDDYAGGSFTISNLGMYGVTSLYPIINPPQSCILGVGALEERPVVRDGAVAVGTVMTCTLSADHRAIDGATGAEFLAAFRHFMEDPWALVL